MLEEVEPIPVGDRIIAVLRWIIMLPAAIVGGYLACLLASMVTGWGLAWYMGLSLESTFAKIIKGAAESWAMAWAYVHISVKISPNYKVGTAVGVTALALMASGALMLASISTRNLVSVISIVVFALGTIAAALSIYSQARQSEM